MPYCQANISLAWRPGSEPVTTLEHRFKTENASCLACWTRYYATFATEMILVSAINNSMKNLYVSDIFGKRQPTFLADSQPKLPSFGYFRRCRSGNGSLSRENILRDIQGTMVTGIKKNYGKRPTDYAELKLRLLSTNILSNFPTPTSTRFLSFSWPVRFKPKRPQI